MCLLVVFLWAGMASGSAASSALFKKGRKQFDDKDYAAACESFAESKRLKNGVGVNYWLGRCHAELGHTASAWAAYAESAALAEARGSSDQAKAAKGKADELEPKLSKLTVKVPSGWKDKLTVKVGKTEVRGSSFDTAIPFDPGKHEVTASAEGYKPWSGSVTVPTTGGMTLNIPELKKAPKAATPMPAPVPSAKPASSSPLFWVGIATAGAGLVAGVIGGVLLAQAESGLSSYIDPVTSCAGIEGIPECDTLTLSYVLIPTGAVLAGVGTTLAILFSGGSDDSDTKKSAGPRITPLLSPSYAGVQVTF